MSEQVETHLAWKGWEYFPENSRIVAEEKTVLLTPCQGALFARLLRGHGQYVHQELLFNACSLSANNADPAENSVLKVQVCYLRRKLRKAGWPFAILTASGIGYKLQPRELAALEIDSRGEHRGKYESRQ